MQTYKWSIYPQCLLPNWYSYFICSAALYVCYYCICCSCICFFSLSLFITSSSVFFLLCNFIFFSLLPNFRALIYLYRINLLKQNVNSLLIKVQIVSLSVWTTCVSLPSLACSLISQYGLTVWIWCFT